MFCLCVGTVIEIGYRKPFQLSFAASGAEVPSVIAWPSCIAVIERIVPMPRPLVVGWTVSNASEVPVCCSSGVRHSSNSILSFAYLILFIFILNISNLIILS